MALFRNMDEVNLEDKASIINNGSMIEGANQESDLKVKLVNETEEMVTNRE